MRVAVALLLLACTITWVQGQQKTGSKPDQGQTDKTGQRSRPQGDQGQAGQKPPSEAEQSAELEKRKAMMGRLGAREMPKDMDSLLEGVKKRIDMSDLKSLGKDAVGAAVRGMNMTLRDKLCEKVMKGGADEEMIKDLKDNGADCLAAMKRDPNMKIRGGEAEIAMKQMRGEKPLTQWNDSDWKVALRQMPGAVKAEDIKKMDRDTVKKMVEDGDFEKARESFKQPSKKKALEKQLKSAYGEPGQWDKDAIEKMGPLMGSMDASTLRQIPKEKMKEAAGSMKDLEFDDRRKKAAAGEKLMEGLGRDKVGSWTSDDIKNADQYIRSNPAILKDLSEESLKGSLESLGSRKTDKRGASQLGERLKKMDEYKDPSQLDKAKVEKMGHLMTGMGKEYLKGLPKSAIEGAIGTLANVTFPRGEAREVLSKIKGKPSEMTASKIREFGQLMTGMDPEDFDAMPDSAIADSLEDLVDKDFDVGQCRAIVKKVKSAGKGHMKKMGGLMAKCMTPDDVSSASIEDLGLNCTDDTPPSFNPDRAQAKEMFKKVREQFGSPSSTNTYYTLTCIKSWGGVAALGMDPSDFENLPDNGDLDSIFEALGDFEADMDDGQTKALGKRLRSHLQLDNSTAMAGHDSAKIERVGKFMKHFTDSDLEQFNSDVKPDVARKLGEANHDKLPQSEKKRMKNFALKHVRNADGTKVEDRRNAATLEDSDVQDLGNLFGGLEEADIKKMGSAATESNLVAMNDKIRGLIEQGAVWTNANEKDTTFFSNSANIIGAAGLSGGIPDDVLNSLDKTKMGENLMDASEMMGKRKTEDDKRDKSGFSQELSDSDRSSMKSKKDSFIRKAYTGYQESQTTSSARRRRATYSLTCADVQALGTSVDSLTSADLDSMSDTQFKDCTETLGAITTWSSSQLTSFKSKLISSYGSSLNTWSTADIKIMGSMIASLSDSEIATLTLTSSTVFANMGKSSAFTSSQLTAGYSAFYSQAVGSSASTVTGDDLINLGAFVCGVSSSNSGFSTAVYKAAASAIGQVSCLSDSTMGIYATLAKSAYGASSTWDSTTITTVGNVIGGLSTSEVSALTSTQISAISASSIAAIPASKMASMSSTQISSFSTAQANAVTSTQQQSMSSSQKTSLVSAGATNVNTSSAPGLIRGSIFMILAAITYTIL